MPAFTRKVRLAPVLLSALPLLDAIRQKNQALQYLRLSSRVDAVASRVETAARMKAVTRSMATIVSAMERSMADMNLEAITKTMDEFERQFEDLDVQSEYVESTINQVRFSHSRCF